jgi:WD40-like Beta Propeller Repeat
MSVEGRIATLCRRFTEMGRLALVSVAVILGATACGTATSLPVRNVLVYEKSGTSPDEAYSYADDAIWRAQIDGTHATRLASGVSPALSPNGRFIAFGHGPDVLVMPASGGAAQRVYTFAEKDGSLYAPRWSPDSRHLAFDTRSGLVVVDTRSHKVHVLRGANFEYSFSPDSRKIVYSDGHGSLYVASALGGKPVRLPTGRTGSSPVWGNPGIAFISSSGRGPGGDIWLSDTTGQSVRQVTHTGAAMFPVSFSANGKVLLAANSDWYPSLFAVDMATGAERRVAHPVGPLVPKGLSADGKTALAEFDCGNNGPPLGELATIPVAGGKPHVIAQAVPCESSWNWR